MRPPAATAAVATQDESMPPERKMPTGTSDDQLGRDGAVEVRPQLGRQLGVGLVGRGRGRRHLPVGVRQAEVAVLPDDGVAGRQLAHLRTIVAGGCT